MQGARTPRERIPPAGGGVFGNRILYLEESHCFLLKLLRQVAVGSAAEARLPGGRDGRSARDVLLGSRTHGQKGSPGSRGFQCWPRLV